jgi:hypothetical protein
MRIPGDDDANMTATPYVRMPYVSFIEDYENQVRYLTQPPSCLGNYI